MNLRLFAILVTASFLLFSGMATMVSAQQYYGNYNYYFTNQNNQNILCWPGGVEVNTQPSVNYNEYSDTGASGWYSYQLQIHTPDLFPGGTQDGFQQTIGIESNVVSNAGITFLGNPANQYYSLNVNPPIPSGVNPDLTSTVIEFFQAYDSNNYVTSFGFTFSYQGNVYTGTVPISPSYESTPNMFQMTIDGNPNSPGYSWGYFLQGQGLISYNPNPTTSGLLDNANCSNEGWQTGESSNMQYNTPSCTGNYCTQAYEPFPVELSLSASPDNPYVGQGSLLTASVNQEMPTAASAVLTITDTSTNQVVTSCAVTSSTNTCSDTVSENSAGTQEFLATLNGPNGYNIASSSGVEVTWGQPSLAISSVDQNSNTITGFYTGLENSGGYQINSGYTPVTFTGLTLNAQYTVYVDNYGSCTFNHWLDNGNIDRERTFTATQSYSFVAVYSCGSSTGSVTVNTVDQNDNPITGYYVGLYDSGGTLINNGFSPVTFSGLTVGANYFVEPDNYGSCTFNHWQDTGSTVRDRSFTAASSQTFTAVYTCT